MDPDVDYSRTLISHEWLAPDGGSENVFEQMAAAMPKAQLTCLWNDAPMRFGPEIAETWLARTPLRRSKAVALPLLPLAWRSVDLEGIDRVVSSSHAFGHQLASRAARSGRAAFAYIHTPARYVWNPELDQRGQGRLARTVAKALRPYDRRSVSPSVSYAANSNFVRDRIRSAWGVESQTIYPPVRVSHIQQHADWRHRLSASEDAALSDVPTSFVLGASRLVPYKRLDAAIRVGSVLGLPVVIAGAGQDQTRLRSLAQESDVPVSFLGRVSDELLFSLYQRASLFVFMAVEDFGIMPVEAMAAGTPVLVNAAGGASESVELIHGGAWTDPDSPRSQLRAAAEQAISTDRDQMRTAAQQFDDSRFRHRIQQWVAG